jgi:hypothetical protein
MDWHDGHGCSGEIVTPCACRRNEEAVLRDAIAAARSDPERWQTRVGPERDPSPTR